MPIFISYTTPDEELAKTVAGRFKYTHNIPCDTGDICRELDYNRGKCCLTPLLVEKLNRCDTFITIVTKNTKIAWWLPFKIGAAREMPRIIATFTRLPDPPDYGQQEALPEYLLEWPRLRSNNDIEVFVTEYKNRIKLIENIIRGSNPSEKEAMAGNIRRFESTVMKLLRQKNY